MSNLLLKVWRNNKAFVLFLLLMFVFRSAVADWNSVPTGSMKPTIVEGDRIFINKMAYDVRLPFTRISLYRHAHPERGDIIVFDSEVSEIRLVKRVIGLPGDTIEMRRNKVFINGEALVYEDISVSEGSFDRTEDLLGRQYKVRVRKSGSQVSSFAATEVPAGHYLALGDNRDSSADSRAIGFVPRDEIVGRSRSVVMSLDYDNYYMPRADRFFHSI